MPPLTQAQARAVAALAGTVMAVAGAVATIVNETPWGIRAAAALFVVGLAAGLLWLVAYRAPGSSPAEGTTSPAQIRSSSK